MHWDEPALGGVGPECRICGEKHPGRICDSIEEVEFFADGGVRRMRIRPRQSKPKREENARLD